MKPAVQEAIEQIRRSLPGHEVEVKEDGDGGAFVVIRGLKIGKSFIPRTSWIGFQITFPYPDIDVYPLFIDPGVQYVGEGVAPNKHVDGDLPTAMTRGATMPGFDLPAIQVSRRSNRRQATTDSALQKVLRVLEFLRSR